MTRSKVIKGHNIEVLRGYADASFDSCVTDPPYEIRFMGKAWDGSGIAYSVELWREVLRVLKPGGHLLAFGGSRTYHRMACAIEDAGFEVRDSMMWLYGNGFPKSLDVAKAIDKAAGAHRPKIVASGGLHNNRNLNDDGWHKIGTDAPLMDSPIPATVEAQQWQGWGTALKPAHEPIVVARKPLSESTVAANVLKWGTGAINIDGCRVETTTPRPHVVSNRRSNANNTYGDGLGGSRRVREPTTDGRWPANVILDEEAARRLDRQTGELGLSSGGSRGGRRNLKFRMRVSDEPQGYGDTGGASRFFYCAKASRKERHEGLESATARANTHPTVKPVALMRYLVRLVTPPGGTVLDTFMGSGTTGSAAIIEGFNFVGIEMNEEDVEIARRRIDYAASLQGRKE